MFDLARVLALPEPVYVRASIPVREIVGLFLQRTKHLGNKIQRGEFKASELLAFLIPRTTNIGRRQRLSALALAFVDDKLRQVSYTGGALSCSVREFHQQLDRVVGEMINDEEIFKRVRRSLDWQSLFSQDEDTGEESLDWSAVLQEIESMLCEASTPLSAAMAELLARKYQLHYHTWSFKFSNMRQEPLASIITVEIGGDFRLEALRQRLVDLECPIALKDKQSNMDSLLFGSLAKSS